MAPKDNIEEARSAKVSAPGVRRTERREREGAAWDHTCLRVLHLVERAPLSGGDGDDRGAHARGSPGWIACDGSECALYDCTKQDGVSMKVFGVSDNNK